MSDRIVVVGGGLAAGTAVVELRERGFDGEITVVADEPHPPYERPPLSKSVLLGEKDGRHGDPPGASAGTPTTPSTCAPAPTSRASTSTGAGSSPPASRSPTTGSSWPPGARPRRLRDGRRERRLGRLPAHHRRLRRTCAGASASGFRLGVIGGGWIGLEAAAAARDVGRGGHRPGVAGAAAAARAGPGGGRRDGRAPPRARRRPAHRRRDHRHRAGPATRCTCRSPTAARSSSTTSWSASGSSPTPSSPRPPGSSSRTASAPTGTCAPRARTSTPPATSPTPTTPSSARPCASSTGTPPSSTARSRPPT